MEHKTASQQITALERGEASSVELVGAAIAAIEARDGGINAVVARDFERARRDARSADEARADGRRAPLLGLPVTVKECFDAEGLVTTWGLPGFDRPAIADSVVVSRLRAAGAILLGKSNVATMLADWQCCNPVYGTTSNPLDRERTAGGSSGGSAAAIAAGFSALEVGTDIAGSLRIPAAFCGVFAHRPSHGLVPMRGSAPPFVPRGPLQPDIDLAAAGPLARSAGDLEMAMSVLAGPDTPFSEAYRLQLRPATVTGLRGVRVLVLDEHPAGPTDETVRAAVNGVADVLRGCGARVAASSDRLPSLSALTDLFSKLLMAFFGATGPQEDYDAAKASFGNSPSGDTFGRASMVMSHRDWVQLDNLRTDFTVRWMRFFEDFDAVICPAAPVTAFAHDKRPMESRRILVNGSEARYDSLPHWSSITIPTGLPSTVMPVGFDPSGLPVGMQVIGPRFGDLTTIAFAALLERELALHPGPK